MALELTDHRLRPSFQTLQQSSSPTPTSLKYRAKHRGDTALTGKVGLRQIADCDRPTPLRKSPNETISRRHPHPTGKARPSKLLRNSLNNEKV
ncbi:MAG: hypothetical protein AAF722_15765 [Cyanobacteria bacterium P01_C01_bin.70]